MMDKYRVKGRYDLWRGVWEIVDSNVPGLAVEASTRKQFVAYIQHACGEHANGRDYRVTVTTKTAFVTIESAVTKEVLVNGKRRTREQLAELEVRHQAAG
jgi:hypothetical protein